MSDEPEPEKIQEYTLQDPNNVVPLWLQFYRNLFNNPNWNFSTATLNFHLQNVLSPNYLSREFADLMMKGVPGLTREEQIILNNHLESLFQRQRQ
jgi:hypothetical protein